MKSGILYCSSANSPSGYGNAARQDITALYNVGVDISCQTIYQMPERISYGWQGELCINLENRNIPYKIKVTHLTPDTALNYMEKGKYHILRLFWETDKLPQGWADICNQISEIWTSSSAIKFMGEICLPILFLLAVCKADSLAIRKSLSSQTLAETAFCCSSTTGVGVSWTGWSNDWGIPPGL